MAIKQKIQTSPEDIGILLLQTSQKISNSIAQALAPLDLTAQQLKILSIVYFSNEERVTVNRIKEQMIDAQSNVSRLLNKLMDKSLIIKTRDHIDQRIVYVSITELGISNMCEGKQLMDQVMQVFNQLSAEQQEQLKQILNNIDV